MTFSGLRSRRLGDGLAIDEGAIAAAEILDQRMIVFDRELRVPPRAELPCDLHLAFRLAPDDIIARPHGLPEDLRAARADDDLRRRNLHGTARVGKDGAA